MKPTWLLLLLAALLEAAPSSAQILVPTRPLRTNTIIAAEDLTFSALDVSGALTRPEDIVGMETRVSLYPGRAIFAGDVGPAALIERNEVVRMEYRQGALVIITDGRSLTRAAVGERVRVMNLDSRTIVTGVVRADKTVEVGR